MTTTEERVSRLEGAHEHFATKADVADVKTELANVKAELVEAKADVKAELANVKADVQELRSELKAMETRPLLRLGGLLIASAGATVAILRFLS